MKLAFTGSRQDPTPSQLEQALDYTERLMPSEFHHGDCVGADRAMHYLVLANSLISIHIHPPTNDRYRAHCVGASITYPPAPYLQRNINILRVCNRLLALPLGPERLRSGTWSTVRQARQRGITVQVIYP